jgi:hypothetical protein
MSTPPKEVETQIALNNQKDLLVNALREALEIVVSDWRQNGSISNEVRSTDIQSAARIRLKLIKFARDNNLSVPITTTLLESAAYRTSVSNGGSFDGHDADKCVSSIVEKIDQATIDTYAKTVLWPMFNEQLPVAINIIVTEILNNLAGDSLERQQVIRDMLEVQLVHKLGKVLHLPHQIDMNMSSADSQLYAGIQENFFDRFWQLVNEIANNAKERAKTKVELFLMRPMEDKDLQRRLADCLRKELYLVIAPKFNFTDSPAVHKNGKNKP